MPELPEVEIARRNLQRWLRGKTIARAIVKEKRSLSGIAPKTLEAALRGRRVKDVARRGKWLRISLDDGSILFSHLGMTGKWIARRAEDVEARFERVRLELEGGASVRYVDPRIFGRVHHARDDIAAWSSLGPDPLIDGIDTKRLAALLAKRKRSIKEVLLDQSVLAGVGNIQAQEALFRARIDPRVRASALDAAQVKSLARAIDASIAFTLKKEKGPELAYVEEPGAANPFLVYGREGEPCPRCKSSLVRIVQSMRATAFCARCVSKRKTASRGT